MALDVYCDLLETLHKDDETLQRIAEIHNQSIDIVKSKYDDMHVFPYCAKGHFHIRQEQYKEAIKCYAQAAHVLSKYNYVKDDEEIYKEMLDVASEIIPQALKANPNLCDDSECYYHIISFYDGICLWEEDSSTPVLHSWWARYFIGAITRFSQKAREAFCDDSVDDDDDESDCDLSLKKRLNCSDASTSSDQENSENVRVPVTKLQLCSHKMVALKDSLTGAKKINTQAISLLLPAQSEVHTSKRRLSNDDIRGDFVRSRRKRRSRDSQE